ncbi:MAG: tetratricopeptide repeat protein [Pseudomonadota bacterium]
MKFAWVFSVAAVLLFLTPALEAQSIDELQRALDSDDIETVQAWADSLDGRTGKLNADELYIRGRLKIRTDRAEAALEDLEAATELSPDRPEIWLSLAEAAGEVAGSAGMMKARGLAKTAKKALERVVKIDPDNLDGRVGLIQFHLQAPWIAGGRTKEAYRQAEAIGQIDPSLGKRWKARIDLAEGKVESAETLYRTLLAEDPGESQAALGLALLLQQQERWSEAVDTLTPFTTGEQTDLLALYQLGRTGALSGQHLAEAEAAFRRYLELSADAADPPVPPSPTWWRLGMVLAQQSRTADARAAFERALTLDPDNQQAAEALKGLSAE